ncbi:CBFA2/RUNX1 partner transcriptional co-repressor nervy [Rhynchophorus ferrugineus]|uniref:CBFA2/RUNX1 partner transcriptional co-repressor nervy n=1 Tax=Rhynchophorus ferrugineus TaxID=354439 RepID=UPI003FCD8BF3
MRKGVESKTVKEESLEKEGNFIETPRSKSSKGLVKDRCKTPDSPEGARQANTPHSPTQSSPPPRNVTPPSNNATAESLTPPPPAGPPTALSLSLDTTRPFTDLQYGAFGCFPPGRQLTKVKKFLSTLVQFGNDINQDVGERVKSLVLNLVSSNLTIEEFHHSLQDVTNFPLKPFVLPFLKTHMPVLQREIHALARMNKQSALQYVRNHDNIILDSIHSPSEVSEIFMSNDGAPLSGVKRRSSEGAYENGINGNQHTADEYVPPTKRATPFLFNHHQNFFLPSVQTGNLFDYQAAAQSNIKIEDSMSSRGDEEWRNIHVMLNCILSMVEKTKRALTILQQRNPGVPQDPTAEWLKKQDLSQDLKKAANDILSAAVRAAEERVAEVRRKAEEAVGDVKRQAVLELQRAVAAAEARAGELLAAERARVEKVLGETRKQTDDSSSGNHADFGDNSQSPSSQPAPSQQNACWNCGRKAHDTCSGCSLARYCGPFCQHKDWENHHQVCNKDKRPALATTPVVSSVAAPVAPPAADARIKK